MKLLHPDKLKPDDVAEAGGQENCKEAHLLASQANEFLLRRIEDNANRIARVTGAPQFNTWDRYEGDDTVPGGSAAAFYRFTAARNAATKAKAKAQRASAYTPAPPSSAPPKRGNHSYQTRERPAAACYRGAGTPPVLPSGHIGKAGSTQGDSAASASAGNQGDSAASSSAAPAAATSSLYSEEQKALDRTALLNAQPPHLCVPYPTDCDRLGTTSSQTMAGHLCGDSGLTFSPANPSGAKSNCYGTIKQNWNWQIPGHCAESFTFKSLCALYLPDITQHLMELAPQPWLVIVWMMNEVYSSLHMINGGDIWKKKTPGDLERISHKVPGDEHGRTLIEKTIDQCAVMIRLRASNVKIIIGASAHLYDLGDYYNQLCAKAVRRFESHGIHTVCGKATFDDLEHKGVHMLKSSANQALFSRRMIEHIADCRPPGDIGEGIPLIT